MEPCTYLRALRLRYGITLTELSKAVGISNQQFSRMELHQTPPTPWLKKCCETALEAVIMQRSASLRALEREYQATKTHLLDIQKEDGRD